MKMTRPILRAFVLVFATGAASALAGPMPVGTSTTTVTYQTSTGPATLSGTLDYTGQTPGDSAPFTGDPSGNVRSFNSVNGFGRRMVIPNSGLSGAPFDDALRPNESLVSHAFFKLGGNNNADFFPGITTGGTVTIAVEGITFSEPAFLDASTVMLHTLWTDSQVGLLTSPYFNLHNHQTLTNPFRNQDAFEHPSINVFNSAGGTPNYILDSSLMDLQIVGNGTTQLDLFLTFSYDALRNFEEQGQTVPAGLPAPQGFLEPFHFHLEYVVAPEPATLLLLGVASGVCALRRRRRLS